MTAWDDRRYDVQDFILIYAGLPMQAIQRKCLETGREHPMQIGCLFNTIVCRKAASGRLSVCHHMRSATAQAEGALSVSENAQKIIWR